MKFYFTRVVRTHHISCSDKINFRSYHLSLTMSSGIQGLLKTEKDAADIVNEARSYRTTRLKSAKVDAQSEIDEYKKQKEQELAAFEKQHAGLNDSINSEADVQVEKELKKIKAKYEQKKSAVSKLLIDATVSPTAEVHVNAKN